jgi:acetylornithine/N-succinyldiaminopimelate aminotransferase
MREALSPATAAILIEGIQGEGGITAATPDYLLGLRAFCDERKLLLLMDGVQCGHFRSGRFQSFQRILEGVPGGEKFLPDGVSMAKSLGGGFPIGAFWVRAPWSDLLGPGTHATTFGGTPMACAVALKVFEIIERDHLADNARILGQWLKDELLRLVAKYPQTLQAARGLGLMMGLELREKEAIPALAAHEKSAAMQVVNRLHEAGLLTIPSGNQVIRLLPALNLTRPQAEEGIAILEGVVKGLHGQ